MRALLILAVILIAIVLTTLFWPSQTTAPSPESATPAGTREETRQDIVPPRRARIDLPEVAPKRSLSPKRPGFRLEGRVVDAFGHGIDNCVILVEHRPATITVHEAEAKPLGEARSDSFGYFWLELQSQKRQYLGPLVVSLDAPRFPPTVVRTDLVLVRDKISDLGALVLSSERGIIVRTKSRSGEAIAGARLTLAPVLDDPMLSTGALLRSRRAAISDSDGFAQFYGVQPGLYRIRAEAARYATKEVIHQQVRASSPSPLQIDLQLGAVQRGRVLTAAGQAVRDATIYARAAGGGPRTQARGDLEGYFRLTGLVQGSYVLVVESPIHGELRLPDIDLPQAELSLNLPAGDALAGQVLDPSGRPLKGAQIVAKSATGWTMIRGGAKHEPRMITDESGLFEFQNMPAGRFELTVSSEGLAASAHGPFDAGDLEIVITVPVTVRVHGKIISREGHGVSGLLEVMNPNYDGSAFAEFARLAVGAGSGSRRRQQGTQEQGTQRYGLRSTLNTGAVPVVRTRPEGFELLVQPSTFRLRFTPDDNSQACFVSRPLEARSDRVFPHLTLHAPAASVFRGIAYLGKEGSPAAVAVTVHLEPIGDPRNGRRRIGQKVQTDANGAFFFSGVASGRYELFYDTRDRQSASKAVASRSRTLESITLDAGASSQRTTLHLLYQR